MVFVNYNPFFKCAIYSFSSHRLYQQRISVHNIMVKDLKKL